MIGSIRNISFSNINMQNLKRNISNISFKGHLPLYLTKALQGDTFEKAVEVFDNEKMKQETPNDFITWAQETDFIHTGLKEALKPENLIGEGFEHACYNIPNNPDYVLRISRSFYGLTQDINFDDYEIQDTRDMRLESNYGQEIARLCDVKQYKSNSYLSGSFFNPDIEVLKKQSGFPDGNPSPRALYHEDGTLREEVLPYEDDSRKEHFVKSMAALASFPDETYDQLIEDLLVSGEAGYRFDHFNSNNFLIDADNQRINIIDMIKMEKPHKDRFGNTLHALINFEFLGEYLRNDSGYQPKSETEVNETIENILTVMNKYTAAMKRKMQKYNLNSYEFYLMLHNMLASFWLKTMDFNEKVEKLKEMGVLYEPQKDEY